MPDSMAKPPAVPDFRFARIARSGTSLVVPLRPELLEALHAGRGTTLEMWLEERDGGRRVLVLTPARSAREKVD